MNYFLFSLFVFLQFSFSFSGDFVELHRPRGVSITKKSLYNPSNDFTCFDGSYTIKFNLVNDDYCDCHDGSDEPGTAACPNGSFYCTNSGFRSSTIPSSRVNDGICDCCDGSDEWNHFTTCANTCFELRKIEIEETKKAKEESMKGLLLKHDYAKIGQEKRLERQEKLKSLKIKLADIQVQQNQLKVEKETLEAQEKEAVDKHKLVMKQKQEQMMQIENLRKGADAFAEMDLNKDASISVKELVLRTELDPDSTDGDFTEAEALALLTNDPVDLSNFMDVVWPVINETFITSLLPLKEELEDATGEDDDKERQNKADRQLISGNVNLPDIEQSDSEHDDYNYEDDDDHDDDGGEDDSSYEVDNDGHDGDYEREASFSSKNDGEYDDVTKTIVDAAVMARKKFEKIEKEGKQFESEIESLNKGLNQDFGTDESFQVLQFQCYELVTLEYKYKLCPFDQASQSAINGGSETVLGRWGNWSGPEENKYLKMRYENGIACWNGPARSTEVVIRCGLEHKLLSVDEPSRCAYRFEFSTPCACVSHGHLDNYPRDEL